MPGAPCLQKHAALPTQTVGPPQTGGIAGAPKEQKRAKARRYEQLKNAGAETSESFG